jgi:PIN domain nuclease of toxin-antitoxin system
VRFLLDTHTTLWWLDSPEKLGKTGYRLIADPANDILISPVVPWELAIKANKGKDSIASPGDGLSESDSRAGFHLHSD